MKASRTFFQNCHQQKSIGVHKNYASSSEGGWRWLSSWMSNLVISGHEAGMRPRESLNCWRSHIKANSVLFSMTRWFRLVRATLGFKRQNRIPKQQLITAHMIRQLGILKRLKIKSKARNKILRAWGKEGYMINSQRLISATATMNSYWKSDYTRHCPLPTSSLLNFQTTLWGAYSILLSHLLQRRKQRLGEVKRLAQSCPATKLWARDEFVWFPGPYYLLP